MSKKLLLDFEEEIEYSIIGISSQLKDYRLIFYLNKLAGFDFKRVESFVFTLKGEEFIYSLYVYLDYDNMRNFYLISNQTNSVKLIKEFKHFDYLLIMDGEIEEKFLKELSKRIKSISGVLLSSILNADAFNKIPNLRTSFDFHLDDVLKEF